MLHFMVVFAGLHGIPFSRGDPALHVPPPARTVRNSRVLADQLENAHGDGNVQVRWHVRTHRRSGILRELYPGV
jgi:hypothetical protein